VLERCQLNVDDGCILGLLLGQGTTHKDFPANVLASANSFQFVVRVSVLERGLCVLLGFLLGLDNIGSLLEFSHDFSMGGHLFGHPAVADNVSHRKTLMRL